MNRKVLLAPSILSADFMHLGDEVKKVACAGADWIHVDVMDGHFVTNLTIGPGHVKALKNFTDLGLDVHLMIDNPEIQVPWYLDAGADSVTIHIETSENIASLLRDIRASGVQAGIAINPETPIDAIESIVGLVDLVLVMSVHPGFGGQTFIDNTPERIARVIRMCESAGVNPLVEVDGGINAETAPRVVAMGADLLVAGNAIFGADDPAAAMREIRKACK